MIKLIYCIRKHADISKTDFHNYWLHQHGPLVRSLAKQLNALKYVQSHQLDTPLNAQARASRDMAPGYDGITEIWWRDEASIAVSSEQARNASITLLKDESTFIDFANSCIFYSQEHEIFDYLTD